MPNKRKFPGGTIGWTGSTMRENQQEDIFLPCDDRLVAVNVGPDPTYGSLVYDTNKNNEFDGDRSAWLQSAFRVLKRPLGGPNAIGFQLYFTGNGETKGGWFVDTGDGSTTQVDVASGATASAGSGMVASGRGVSPLANKGSPITYTTLNAGKSGGVIIGQGSYNDGGPFHVGNKADKHNNGFDADGNPINSLHIDTAANFYKNQAQDGPLRFENTYQKGQDAPIVVPVHLGWTGRDWAWWSTSYFYNPDPTPTPRPTPYPYPYYPGTPSPGVPTTGNPTIPTTHPIPGIPSIGVPTGGVPTTGTINPNFGGGVGAGGSVTNPYFGGGSSPGATPAVSGGTDGGNTGTTGGDTTGGGVTGGGGGATAGATPQPGDIIGYTDDGIPIRQPPAPSPPDYRNPPPPSDGGSGGAPSAGNPPSGPPTPHIPPDIDIYVLPDPPVIIDVIGNNSGPAMNMISSIAATTSQATQYTAQNYNPNAASTGIFNSAMASGSSAASSQVANKGSNSDPLCGAASSFASQGGTTPSSPAPGPSPSPPSPSPSPTPSPTPASTTGGQGDPFNYTTTPRNSTDPTKQKSKYKRGTASGGICYHPSETDLRDIPVGLVPQNTSMSTTTVAVGPNAYFAAGVPELVTGSIKSGYRWGVDTTTGDLVFYSISYSQPAIEAVRFCNTGQVIRWRSTENVYGELSHANTGNQRYTFPDKTGTVALTSDIVGNAQYVVRQQSDQSVVGTTLTAATNLALSMAASTNYHFRFVVQYTVDTAVSGSKIDITSAVAPTAIRYWARTTNTAGTVVQSGPQTALGATLGYATATTGTTYLLEVEGLVENSGTAQSMYVEFANNTGGATMTLLRGSFAVISTSG